MLHGWRRHAAAGGPPPAAGRRNPAHWRCAAPSRIARRERRWRSEEHTSELQSLRHLVCRLLLEKNLLNLTHICTRLVPHFITDLGAPGAGALRGRRPDRISASSARAPEIPRRVLYFFFNDTATTEIYTLSLHDALPI